MDKKLETKTFKEKVMNNKENTMALSMIKDVDGNITFDFTSKDNRNLTVRTLAHLMNQLLKEDKDLDIFIEELSDLNKDKKIVSFNRNNKDIDEVGATTEKLISVIEDTIKPTATVLAMSNGDSQDLENPNMSLPVVSYVDGSADILAYQLNKIENILSGDAILLKQKDAMKPEDEETRQFMETFKTKMSQLKDYQEKIIKKGDDE